MKQLPRIHALWQAWTIWLQFLSILGKEQHWRLPLFDLLNRLSLKVTFFRLLLSIRCLILLRNRNLFNFFPMLNVPVYVNHWRKKKLFSFTYNRVQTKSFIYFWLQQFANNFYCWFFVSRSERSKASVSNNFFASGDFEYQIKESRSQKDAVRVSLKSLTSEKKIKFIPLSHRKKNLCV